MTETTTQIYKPSLAIDLSTEAERQIRIGIQGVPGAGKTTSAMTFPNPVVVNWDRGLRAFQGRSDIIQFPMYDREFIEKKLGITLVGRHEYYDIPKVCRTLLQSKDCQNLVPEQTLVWDSWTSHQDAFDLFNWEPASDTYTAKGAKDEFAPWDRKQDHCKEVLTLLAGLNCNVVVIFHTSQQRDKETGKLLDKIQPLLQGGYMPKLKKHFPFFFNQLVKDSQYVWQIKSDNNFDAKLQIPADKYAKAPAFIPANYSELMKYLTT